MSMQSNSRKMHSESGYADAMKDVQKLIADGVTSVSPSLLNKLRQKHSDSNLVDMIVEGLSERVNTIRARANKFAKAIIKHSGQNTPLHTMLKRALRYKEKLGLADAEFEFFKKILYSTLAGKDNSGTPVPGYQAVNSNLSRALGNVDVDNFEGINVEQADYPFLNEIIKQHTASKPLHASIVLQSMMYRSFAPEAIFGDYDSQKHNPSCFVNPILAAFFIPKIGLFEETFLLANIAYIVRCRYEKTQVLTHPDYLLLFAMISDPNDVVCDLESPFKDLRNRVQLQETLWQSVSALRNGRYYDCISSQFLTAVDNCKISTSDAPDVIYLGDEATILRRLLQAFSFRPIVVSTVPLFGVVTANSANFPVVMNRVTAIPMITVRLPVMTQYDQNQVSLEQSLREPQYHLENNTLVPKVQEIIYTRGVIIFHVTRRTQVPKFQRMVVPGSWNDLLPTISAYEKINRRPVYAEPYIDVGFSVNLGNNEPTPNQRHTLRSVVMLKTNPLMPELIVGTAALLVNHDDHSQLGSEYMMYDPQGAAIKVFEDGSDRLLTQSPITKLDYENTTKPENSFTDKASKQGTIYIYSELDKKERRELELNQ